HEEAAIPLPGHQPEPGDQRALCMPTDWRLHHLSVGRTGHPRHRRGHGIPCLAQAELLCAMNKLLLFVPVGLALSLAGLALAQSAPEGIDLDAIRERAGEHA